MGALAPTKNRRLELKAVLHCSTRQPLCSYDVALAKSTFLLTAFCSADYVALFSQVMIKDIKPHFTMFAASPSSAYSLNIAIVTLMKAMLSV